jgi:tetratricopeptide (TPR) repeat protein
MTEEKTPTTAAPAQQEKKKQEPDPKVTEALKHLQAGNAAYAKQDQATAEAEYRKALAIKDDFRDALFNLGVLLRDDNRFDQAKPMFQKMIDTQPRAAMARNNLGVIAGLEGDPETAIKNYRMGIEEAFQSATIHFNLGMLLLRLGQYEEGWKECEWRWQTDQFAPLRCLQPRWDGSRLDGTLLVHTEQGAGDTFQFLRFLPQIRERCQRVMLVSPDHLMCMLGGDQWADEVRAPGEFKLDQFVAYLPLMSAPFALKVHDEAAIPAEVPYLTPEDRQVDMGEPHVADAKLKVGLSWAGSPTHANDKYRSMHATKLAKLLSVPGVAFYSLQKGPQTEQLQEIAGDTSSLRDLDDLQKDYADTAAIVKQLDLVISVDTSVLHLSGGLAHPTWGLLSTRCDWRWQQDREDSPWYPTLRLFRQKTENDWDELLDRVAAELTAVVDGRAKL